METIYFLIFIYLVFISFAVRTVRNSLYIIFLWQLKEYRFDRMLAHLKTTLGKKLLINHVSITKTILVFIWIFATTIYLAVNIPTNLLNLIYVVTGSAIFFFWLIWIVEASKNIKELVTRGWLTPKFTLKALLILIIVLLFQFPFIFLGLNLSHQVIFGIFLDRLLNPSVTFLILLFNIPTEFYKKWTITRAKQKIRQISQIGKLIVIGITGSYGKTSTKEFLATILAEKFKVAKSPEFTNTAIGIVNFILQELEPDHEIFVVEMGAYKRGEIKDICDTVKPKIGIITGINEQHLELLGSIENTMKTKFELIESLPNDGIAILNGNNKYCLKMADWSKKRRLKTLLYNQTRDVKNIKAFTDHLEFTLADKNYLLKVNLLGKQAIENLLAAIYAAKNLGLTMEEIKKGIVKIGPALKTMHPSGNINGMTLIDDTFNANPDGVIAAVDYMKLYKGKKILVLTPLIELGSKAEDIHESIGEKVAAVCDLILLTNINYHKSFVDGARKVAGEDKIQIVNTAVAVKLIEVNLGKNGVVVFEGKEAGRILEILVISH